MPEQKEPPTLVVYWTDTLQLLTHQERKEINGGTNIESVTPSEVLFRVPAGRWYRRIFFAHARTVAVVSRISAQGAKVLAANDVLLES